MHTVAALIAISLILLLIWEVFETLILPRRVQRRVRFTRFFYVFTWRPWRALSALPAQKKLRDLMLGVYGPAALLLLFGVWTVILVAAYALLFWGSQAALVLPAGFADGIWSDLYLSGTTFFTLGIGDITPRSGLARLLTVIEAGNGLAFLAIVISYLPTLYGSFSKREVNISLLDARAGSPATAGELLRRHAVNADLSVITPLLADWEEWAAELMESHISYPALCYFRSQHSNQSWVSALTAILDTCALVITGVEGVGAWQARLTFAMARHALVDITQVFHLAPIPAPTDRMPYQTFAILRDSLAEVQVVVGTSPDACSRLRELRDQYEPYAEALGQFLVMPLPPWSRPAGSKDNWTTSAWKLVH